jgi:hypothetical protein
MPTIDIVQIEDLDQEVAKALCKISDAVVIARAAGVQAELPAKVDFQINVVSRWQVLEVVSAESGESKENGKSTEKGGTTTSDINDSTETRKSVANDTHVESDESEQDSYQT